MSIWEFVNTNADSTARLTPEAFDAFCRSEAMRPPLSPRPIIVSRREAVRLDVGMRSESWHRVRKPWLLRWRSFVGALRLERYYDESRRDHWRYAWRRLRESTHGVLTPEARREIEWRIAEIRPISMWSTDS